MPIIVIMRPINPAGTSARRFRIVVAFRLVILAMRAIIRRVLAVILAVAVALLAAGGAFVAHGSSSLFGETDTSTMDMPELRLPVIQNDVQ